MIRLVGISLLLSLLLVAGCGDRIPAGRTEAPAEVIRGLGVVQVASATLPGAERFVGTVESPDRGFIAARIDGRVGSIAVREGESVRAGQLLLTIAQNSANDRLAEAAGAQKAAAARAELAEKTMARYQQLQAAEAVTPQELDRVAAELEMARQGLKSAAAALAQAATTQALTRVSAPFAGRVARREIEVGSTVLPGTPLLVIDRSGGARVRLDVPESFVSRMHPGDVLEVEIPALARTFVGTVTLIEPAADPVSRSFQVKVDLADASGLTPGLFARAGRPRAGAESLLVPATAVVHRGQLSGVYVVENGVLHFRLIKTGRQLGANYEVLSGLAAGESVVVHGVERVRSGARVGG